MSDMVFHGLQKLLGGDFYHSHPYGYMFSDFPLEKVRRIYGRGFTLYRLLDCAVRNVPDDLQCKIASRFFDRIVYGQIRRCADYIDLVKATYPEGTVAYVDGEDRTSILKGGNCRPYLNEN